jgi:hypothetical protein
LIPCARCGNRASLRSQRPRRVHRRGAQRRDDRRAKEARAAFETALSRTPGRTTALLGLMRAATALGDQAKAADVRRQLRAIWRRADGIPPDVK